MSDPIVERLGQEAPWIVGVLNVTPDSFSDGGRHLRAADAVAAARAQRLEGAALVEIGGESTAPGNQPLTADQELARIEPVLQALAGELPVGVDTYHARTAARALELGAVLVNDVSALRAEPELARPVAEHGALLVLMHAKDGPLPHATDRPARYGDVAADVASFLLGRAELAMRAGVAQARIVLDPGAGRFLSHDPADSWRLLAEFERLVELVRPFRVMVATSRKGFLGGALATRDPASQLTAVVALMRGATLVRTHAPGMAREFVEVARRTGLLPSAAPT